MIRCACGNVLGEVRDGHFEMRHRGRRLVTPMPISIGCEDCGSEWKPDTNEDRDTLPVLVALA